jgi:hypothetical protein
VRTDMEEAAGAGDRLWVPLALFAVMAVTSVGCGPAKGDIHDAFNSHDTGSYQRVDRQTSEDGTVVIHVEAQNPEHAQEIAEDIVAQNYALSPRALRVIIDPAGGGERRVYRWDAHGLRVDTSRDGIPPPLAGAERKGTPH